MATSYLNALGGLAEAALTPRQAYCLAAFCFDGVRQREIGWRLGTTRQAVSQCIGRGRRRLAKLGLTIDRLEDNGPRGRVFTCPTQELDRLRPEQIKATW